MQVDRGPLWSGSGHITCIAMSQVTQRLGLWFVLLPHFYPTTSSSLVLDVRSLTL